MNKLDSSTRLYNLNIPVIGLTGGIATGKSTVSSMLKNQGLSLIDADLLVKEIYKTPDALAFVKKNFPMCWNDAIDFKALRQVVFDNPLAKQLVERFIYARLPEAFLKEFSEFNNPSFIIYDAPLLFEKNLNLKVDSTALVYAPRELQKTRLMNRDKSSPEQADKILNQQMNIEDKKVLSDYLIFNTKDLSHLEQEVQAFIKELLNTAK